MSVAHFKNYEQDCRTFVRSLYPTIRLNKVELEVPLVSAAADGVACAQSITTSIGALGSKSVFMAEEIPHKILGCLDKVAAIITLNEDKSSHTAIVARAQGVPVVNVTRENYVSIEALSTRTDRFAKIAVDTFKSRIFLGDVELDSRQVQFERRKAMATLRATGRLKVHANADSAKELQAAIALGFTHAWPRSETLLYDEATFSSFVAFLLKPTCADAKRGFIRGHTAAIRALFNSAEGTRVAFRLLDPPSHEFLPREDDIDEISRIGAILGLSGGATVELIKAQTETNPMIGHRGARLLLTNRELLRAQVTSMFSAWLEAEVDVRPPAVEVLVPFIMLPAEMEQIKAAIELVRSETPAFGFVPIKYGAMVELPSLLDYPEQIAGMVDFISFGTNDLVSVTHGISRGDAYSRYLKSYLDDGLMEQDPFFILPAAVIDKIQTFCLRAREVNRDIETDICGEQALGTDLTPLIRTGALTSVSIGTENLPILLTSLLNCGLVALTDLTAGQPSPDEALAPA